LNVISGGVHHGAPLEPGKKLKAVSVSRMLMGRPFFVCDSQKKWSSPGVEICRSMETIENNFRR
jgi:hypothetical protein